MLGRPRPARHAVAGGRAPARGTSGHPANDWEGFLGCPPPEFLLARTCDVRSVWRWRLRCSPLPPQLLDLGLYEAACLRRSDELRDAPVGPQGQHVMEAVGWPAAAQLTPRGLSSQHRILNPHDYAARALAICASMTILLPW